MNLLDRFFGRLPVNPYAYNLFGRNPLAEIGDVVIYVSCDGCMASEHNIKWIGEVCEVSAPEPVYGSPRHVTKALCMVLKRGHRDHRDASMQDKDFRMETFVREDTCAQRLGTNLIVIFK